MKIYFYETPGGNSPIKKFIDSLSSIDQARFLEVIDEIELNGLSASRVIFKPLEGKLWEIKFNTASSGYRALYVMLDKDLMIWLHAFTKKTQKTSKQDLDLARKRLKEVLK
ncbi:MAG: type II toxin-antitoxin system RelE/ParE family toxin [Pseudobdellovibrionaceae bacterium]